MVPALFIGHGSPMMAVQTNDYSRFLGELGQRFKPKAIAIFSAHWESEELALTYTDGILDTIYDFYGFPDELYQVKYPAKGSVAIAEILEDRFKREGIQTKREQKRGLDHGSWVALKHMYPNADIPVVQLSVNPYLTPKEQHRIGRALQGLGTENILVVGSGHTVHNLRWLFPKASEPKAEAVQFDDWIIDKVQKWDIDSLDRYTELAPHARLAVPRPEHFVPLFLAMGGGDENKAPIILHRSYEVGTFSNLCFEF